MKYRNKTMLIVLLVISLLVCAYVYVPFVADFVNKLYDGKYNSILIPIVFIAIITVVGILVIASDKAKIVTENVVQTPTYDKENKMIMVSEDKKENSENEKR